MSEQDRLAALDIWQKEAAESKRAMHVAMDRFVAARADADALAEALRLTLRSLQANLPLGHKTALERMAEAALAAHDAMTSGPPSGTRPTPNETQSRPNLGAAERGNG